MAQWNTRTRKHLEWLGMTEGEFLLWLKANSDAVRTPAYIYSESMLDAALAELKTLFPDDVRVFYSLKANPQPGLVRYLSRLGVGGEIASPGEFRMCRVADLPAAAVLVGGVSKSAEYLASVCDQGTAGVVVDSPAEWCRLREVVSAGRTAQVLLRVNPGVALGGLDMAGDSQFGLQTEQALAIARECQSNSRVEFMGLHFYFGSQRLSSDPIVEMVQAAGGVLNAFSEAGVRVNLVDLGLGCGVPYLEKDARLDTADVRAKLQPIWQSTPWSSVRLWTEAGRALAGRAGFFVARVLERKARHDKVFIFLDGGLNVHNPGIGVGRFFRSNPRFLFIRGNDRPDNGATESVEIVGNLCTSADSLGRKVTVPVLDEGDLVVIPNSGSYCQTTGLWGFNSQPLFSEAMLTRDGKLNYIEPQYSVLLSNSHDFDSGRR
jgi:diaminopimelate decarboxylase